MFNTGSVFFGSATSPLPTPATVTGANNGLSVAGTNVQLGQANGDVTNPAALLNTREIPFGVRSLYFTGLFGGSVQFQDKLTALPSFFLQILPRNMSGGSSGSAGSQRTPININSRFAPDSGEGNVNGFGVSDRFEPTGGDSNYNTFYVRPTLDAVGGNGYFTMLCMEPVIISLGDGIILRGIYFNPQLLDIPSIIAFENVVGENYLNSQSGATHIGPTAPSGGGWLNLAAGTGGAGGTVPMEITPGTLRSPINSPCLEVSNDGWYETNASVNRYAKGGFLADFYTTIGNSAGVETDLYSYTTKVNTLGGNGQKIIAMFSGTTLSATSTIRALFAGTQIFTTGAIVFSAASWQMNITIIRTGATTARAITTLCYFDTTSGVPLTLATQTDLTGLTFSNTNIIKCTGNSAGANNVVAKLGTIEWYGAANN